MKNSFSIAILLGGATLLTSCAGDSPENTPYIRMEVNGQEWYDETVAVSGINTFEGDYNISVTGTNENYPGGNSGLAIVVTSTTDIAEGIYDIKDYEGGATVTGIDGKTYLMTDATEECEFQVTITAIQSSGSIRKIRGTFSGTLAGPTPGEILTVTDGEFAGY